jgi:hypothetical protein
VDVSPSEPGLQTVCSQNPAKKNAKSAFYGLEIGNQAFQGTPRPAGCRAAAETGLIAIVRGHQIE